MQLHNRESLEEGENLAIHRKFRHKRVLSDYFTGSGRGLLAIMINPWLEGRGFESSFHQPLKEKLLSYNLLGVSTLRKRTEYVVNTVNT